MNNAVETVGPRPKKYSRWRAATLASVYLLFGLHIAHWKIAGKTLAPLELNEVMYTLELGIVTAGFILMAAAALSVLFFGRFFCSWGCHILALEDLANWLLNKIGIRPRPVRSRALLLVPPAALLYMFVWPQILRINEGRPLAKWRVFTDLDGWGSFVTNDFWRNLPGPWITAVTFLICGFAIVYVLGSRSFCRYACPYGVVFGLMDRASPGQIKATEGCEQCGSCTAACTSNIHVHEELKEFGRVVSPSCLKDLDCVSVCPHEAVKFSFGKPSLFSSWKKTARRMIKYDFSLGEDLLMVATFIVTLVIFRGLYGAVPFLMMLGLSGIFAYLAVVCVRVVRSQNVRLANLQLKSDGRLKRAGVGFIIFAIFTTLMIAHSAFIRYHEVAGERAYQNVVASARTASAAADAVLVASAIRHLEATDRWGLFKHPFLTRRLATLHLVAGDAVESDRYLERVRHDDEAKAHELVAEFAAHRGDLDGSVRAYRAAIAADPSALDSRLALAAILANTGQFGEAAEHLAAAAEIQPDDSRIHYNLATVLSRLGRVDEAIRHYGAAAKITPGDPNTHNTLGYLLVSRGDQDAAEEQFRTAIELNPDFAHPHYNLGRLLVDRGDLEEGNKHLTRAATLDPRYSPHQEKL